MSRPFLKMNGLGNDFVVVEARADTPYGPFEPGIEAARAIANRQTGIGCDQIIAIGPSDRSEAMVRFWNADGEEVGACGNGARCVAWLLMEATGKDEAHFETKAGLLSGKRAGDKIVTVDMGEPGLDWTDIPLAEEMDTRGIELQVGPIDAPVLHTPGCVSMGNPHVVFFVPDAETAPVRQVGPLIENHPLFPERTNVGFAQIKGPDRIRLRVWERGAGLTKACGTGACAALVAAHRRGLIGRKAVLELDGGELTIEWRESDNHVLMTGPVEVEFTGTLP
ncbi:MAG: diaminopimelate epimerase [Caulobacteraceae bacterium]|nr:diaminopimelate epimerase [Caulobacteraceae bacterium]